MAMINDCDHNLLVWIDLEMSGLDLNIHTIVEIAIAITDFHLKNYIEGPDIVIHHDQDVLDKMNDWSRTQHTKSGLIELIRHSQISLYDAETQVIDFLKRHCPPGTGILAGNSVFVDRWFIEKYMPRLHTVLHPSIVDCSTLKELTLRWQPVRYTQRPHKQMMHRARDDIRESINELNHYRQHNFYLTWHTIRHPPYLPAPALSNPRTHLVWLKTDSDQVNHVYVIITDGNLNILNDIYLDMNEKCNQYSLLVGFLHRNILVNRSSPICGQCVHIDRARIERIVPELLSCCHYRSIDVDVLNVLCRRWARQVYESRPIICANSNDLVTELQGSIQLLQYYRANVFKFDLFVQEKQS
ncbi:unnamed protein product [Rotaria socialis]|uniref:Exonuclease domain-containing protein n=1 Tax=Rotaria socialis TaxID=392032 RepID=A0A817S7V9_9BILA|nr:unnamed protein product [Rotaria socialis]CAF3375617.1 unnamed protein product [Rotaria socialis]CAF3654244.1 unnamed protein product [Rotaria socialis]CAF3674217.1 unnamed protein product [Rotaria socialis]CAF3684203.1 unnamed protein product [Rotaria socialis]